MSDRDNVEIVKAALEAWAVDAATGEQFHPEVEVVMPHPGMSVSGLDQMRSAMRDFREMWDSYEFEVEEVRALPDDRVVALFTERVRGAASGIEQVAQPGVIFTLSDGKIVRFEAHLHREDVLRAAGLPE